MASPTPITRQSDDDLSDHEQFDGEPDNQYDRRESADDREDGSDMDTEEDEKELASLLVRARAHDDLRKAALKQQQQRRPSPQTHPLPATAAIIVEQPVALPVAAAPLSATDGPDDVACEKQRQILLLVPHLKAERFVCEHPPHAPLIVAQLRYLSDTPTMKALVVERVRSQRRQQQEAFWEQAYTKPKIPIPAEEIARQRADEDASAEWVESMWCEQRCCWADGAADANVQPVFPRTKFTFFTLRHQVKKDLGEAAYEQAGLQALERKLHAVEKASKRAARKVIDHGQVQVQHDMALQALAEDGHVINQVRDRELIREPLTNLLDSLRQTTVATHRRVILHCSRVMLSDAADNEQIDLKEAIPPPEAGEGEGALTAEEAITANVVTPAQCQHHLIELLRADLGGTGDERFEKYCARRANLFCLSRTGAAIIVDDNHGLARLFADEVRADIKVINDRGDFFEWNPSDSVRLWQRRAPGDLFHRFKVCAKRLIQEEMKVVQHAFYTSSALVTTRKGDKIAGHCTMLGAMLDALNVKAQHVARGDYRDVLLSLIRGHLRDHTFEGRLNSCAPDHFPMRDGWLIDMKQWSLTRNYEECVRKREPSDLFSFASPAMFQRPDAVRQMHGFANVIAYMWPLTGGTRDRRDEVIRAYRQRLFPDAPGPLQPRTVPMEMNHGDATDKDAKVEAEQRHRKACEMLESLWVHFGYMLTGRVSERKCYMHYGPKRRGKSSMWDKIMRPIMGQFLVCPSADLMVQLQQKRDAHQHTAALIPLIGARAVRFEEPNRVAKLDADMIRTRCTGGPWIETVRAVGGSSMMVEFFYKMAWISNWPPQYDRTHDANEDRWEQWSYQTCFDKNDVEMKALFAMADTPEFLDEAFSFLIEGAGLWYVTESTPSCKLSQEIEVEFRHKGSPIDAFLHAKCDRAPANQPIKLAAGRKRKREDPINNDVQPEPQPRLEPESWEVERGALFQAYIEWYTQQVRDGEYPDRSGEPAFKSRMKVDFFAHLDGHEFQCKQVTKRVKNEKSGLWEDFRPRVYIGLRLKSDAPVTAPGEPVEELPMKELPVKESPVKELPMKELPAVAIEPEAMIPAPAACSKDDAADDDIDLERDVHVQKRRR